MLVLASLPVSEMTIEELEGELLQVKEIYSIFKGVGPDYGKSTLDAPIQVWAQRMHDIEAELLERTLLK